MANPTRAGLRRNYNPASGLTGSQAADHMADNKAMIASKQMLAAQLRTGQHALKPEAFWQRVRELRAERYL